MSEWTEQNQAWSDLHSHTDTSYYDPQVGIEHGFTADEYDAAYFDAYLAVYQTEKEWLEAFEFYLCEVIGAYDHMEFDERYP